MTTKEELLEKLRKADKESDMDPESAHYAADAALLEFINDPEVKEAFTHICKWYS
jgi:hypothetical protein